MKGMPLESELRGVRDRILQQFGYDTSIRIVSAVFCDNEEFIEVAVSPTVECLNPEVQTGIRTTAAPFEVRFRSTTSEEDDI